MSDEMYLSEAERKEAQAKVTRHRFGEFVLPDDAHIKFGGIAGDKLFANGSAHTGDTEPARPRVIR